jgi:phosphoribosylformylglycinamidine synthase
MAVGVVDEAIRNAAAAGADPDRIALLDNFCWGDPANPETLGTLVEAARGCHDAAVHYGTPFISGKDSLNNEYLGADGKRHAIPPTLLISAIGIIEDVSKAVTTDLKTSGDRIYRVAPPAAPLLPDPAHYRALHRAMQAGLVRACHDLSEGGLLVAAAEMCIGGRLGMTITCDADTLFAECNGHFLVEVRPDDCTTFEAIVSQAQQIGNVAESALSVNGTQWSLEELVTAWT